MLGSAANKHAISYNLSSGVHLLTQVNKEALVRGLPEAICIDN